MKNKMNAWYEEDEQVFVHPKDPYHRVDVLASSRRVKVTVNGEVVAETERPKILFETGLPPRYYIPEEDASGDVLAARRPPGARTRASRRTTRSRPGTGASRTSSGTTLSRCPRWEDPGAPVLLQREGGPRGAEQAADAVVVEPLRVR